MSTTNICRHSTTAALVAISSCFALTTPEVLAATETEPLYQSLCANCHGTHLEGGLGGSLIDDTWVNGNSKSAIRTAINEGSPKGMPPWQGVLSPAQIDGLVDFILEKGEYAKIHGIPQVIASKPHQIQVETIKAGFDTLWAMDFLPDGSLIVTEKQGKLWHIKGKQKTEITGIPAVWDSGQGGLLDVRVLKGDSEIPWIYLSYSKRKYGHGGMTAIVRGQIKDNELVNQQIIFDAPLKTYLSTRHHYGSRIALQGDYVYFTIGDRGERASAQDLSLPNGKVHRVHLDGAIPADNPFVETANAMPSIWSYGHRNPQGLAFAQDGKLWSAEHGPKGGDETNLIEKGKNYGWPVITYGRNYSGSKITDITHKEGMEQPKHYWTPSIAVSDITEYQGAEFSNWQNQLLAASLKDQELQRLKVDDAGKVLEVATVLEDYGRIRDVRVAPDGSIYLVVNDISRTKGKILRLTAK